MTPQVPQQLRNFNGSWFTILYLYLVKLVAYLAQALGAVGNTVCYQQGGSANPLAGIYTTWATALAAAQVIAPALAPQIIFDPSFGQPVIPSGSWNIAGITLSGPDGVPATVNVLDGAVLAVGGALQLRNGLVLNSQATTTSPITVTSLVVMSLDGVTPRITMGTTPGAGLTTDPISTVPFISVPDGVSETFLGLTGDGLLFMFLNEAALLQSNGAAPVISVAAGSALGVALNDFSQLSASTLASAAGSNMKIQILNASVTMSTTQPGILGNLQVTQVPTNATVALALSAGGGAETLPARPSQLLAPQPTRFFATPSGNQASATTYTLQTSGYFPGDIVRIFFTHTQMNAANVTVADGGGSGTLTVLLVADTGASGFAWCDAQLNTAGSHWTVIAGGYN